MLADIITKSSIKKLGAIVLSSLIISLFGCDSKEGFSSINSENLSDSCLEGLVLTDLKEALRNCTLIIKNNPEKAKHLNARSLIYILLGQDNLACIDIKSALDLTNKEGQDGDPLLGHELNIRHTNCMQRRIISGND